MQAITLDDLIARLAKLPKEELRQLDKASLEWAEANNMSRWQPNPGPQSEAYFSKADCLLYGGEPGGGKSALCLGLAYTAHERSLIMRREYGDLDRLIEDTLKIHGSKIGFNGSPPPKLVVSENHIIDFGAASRIGDEQKFMGRGHDLLAVDEATHFAESQIRFMMGWVRTETPGQRTRTVLATNPPLRPEGLWVNKMFAPWLDPRFSNPAKPGELRWVIVDDDDNDIWVEGPGQYDIGGRMVWASSRSYIPASIEDNPFYVNTNYRQQIDGLPAATRALLTGGFKVGFKDADNQLIPTAWIRAAMERWTPRPPEGIPMCAIGADASGGGTDPFVMALRHGGWYAPFVETPAKEIPIDRAGRFCAGIIMSYRRDGALVAIDLGGGYGSSTYEQLKENEIEVQGFKGAEASTRRTKDGLLGFANRRAEVYWRFREALDPGQPGGSTIALPDDPLLMADLAAPVLIPDRKVIELEPKEKLCERLGRSPDRGDSAVICWATGPMYVQGGEALERFNRYGSHGFSRKRPEVVMGRGKYSLTGRT